MRSGLYLPAVLAHADPAGCQQIEDMGLDIILDDEGQQFQGGVQEAVGLPGQRGDGSELREGPATDVTQPVGGQPRTSQVGQRQGLA